MNRRQVIRRAIQGAAVLTIAPGVVLQTACGDTTQLVRWTMVVIGALKDVSPILVDMGANAVTALIAKALPIAERLKKAFEDNDHASIVDLLDNLINPQTGIAVEIANAVGALADDNRKRIVLGILAIGMVALRLISAEIETTTPAAAAETVKRRAPGAARAIQAGANARKLEQVFNVSRF